MTVKDIPHPALVGLAEYCPCIVMVKHVDSDTIVYINRVGAESAGYAARDIIGSASSKFYAEHDAYHREDKLIVAAGKLREKYVEQYRDAQGRTVILITNKWPHRDSSGDYVVAAAIDMTAMRRLLHSEAVDIGDSMARLDQVDILNDEALRLAREIYGN